MAIGVHDALEDHRTELCSLLIDAGLRAYLGVPLNDTSGATLGALCVIDNKPRVWQAQDVQALQDLVDVASMVLQGRVQESQHHQSLQYAANELQAAEARLTDAEKTLSHAQKMEVLGQLTGGIAHDFNNVLAGVSGALHVLERTVEGTV